MAAQDSVLFGQRLRQWRREKGLSAYWLAKRTGVHPSFMSNIEAERRPMPPSLMKKLAAIPEMGITYEALRSWKLQSDYGHEELQEAFSNANLTAGDQDASTAGKRKSKAAVKQLEGLHRLPLKMMVSAGPLKSQKLVEENVSVDWYGLDEVTSDLFCMKVQGDSMWPPIPDGAILLVKETDTLTNGEKYVVETSEKKMTFKVIRFDRKGAMLVPLNPLHQPIALKDTDVQHIYQVLSYKVDWV